MILITGVSGFIGKHLLSAFTNEFGKEHILAVTSSPISSNYYLLHKNYHFEDDYFINEGFGKNIDTIIHAGAFIPKSIKQANDWEKCNGNIFTTDKLLHAHLPNLKKIIYLSTIDVYGKSELISESSLTNPSSFYGESKLYVEKLITVWANANDKVYQILRLGHVYGPGEEEYQKVIPVSMKKLLQNEPLQIWGTGNEIRSFIYIKDIIKSILQAVKLDVCIGPVNLVSTQKISISELVNKLISLSGLKASIQIIPSGVPGRDLVFNNNKMKKHLLSAETLLDDGLLEEWEYMKKLEL